MGANEVKVNAEPTTRLQYCSELKACMVSASWERFYLRFEIEVRGAVGETCFFLASNCPLGKVGAVLAVVRQSQNTYLVEVNMANNGWCECIQQGSYRIEAVDDSMRWSDVAITPGATADLEDMARAFPYGKQNRAQVIYFDIADGLGFEPTALVEVEFTELDRNGFESLVPWRGGYRDLSLAAQVKHAVREAGKRALSTCCLAARPILKAHSLHLQVAFLSERSDELRPNMRAVRDRLSERGLDSDFDLSVSCHAPVSGLTRLVNLLDELKAFSRADIVVVDDYVPALTWLDVPGDMTIIELWHAGAGFKAAGYARWGLPGTPPPVSAHRKNTYAICSSAKIAPFFSEVFGIEDERIIPTGMPRMDGFLDEERLQRCCEAVRAEYPQCEGKQVILFAPTYRGEGRRDAHYPFEMVDFDALYQMCGDERVVLFKMHPWVSDSVPVPTAYRDRLVDVGGYSDINDLFPIADLLVTDYSSSVFEFSLLRKPMLFFAFDKEVVVDTRGFHRPYEQSAPGKVCATFAEVIDAIEHDDFEFDKVERFVEDHFGRFDDGSADRVIDWLILGDLPDEFAQAIAAREGDMAQVASFEFDRDGSGVL